MPSWTPIQVKWSVETPDHIPNNTAAVCVSEITWRVSILFNTYCTKCFAIPFVEFLFSAVLGCVSILILVCFNTDKQISRSVLFLEHYGTVYKIVLLHYCSDPR